MESCASFPGRESALACLHPCMQVSKLVLKLLLLLDQVLAALLEDEDLFVRGGFEDFLGFLQKRRVLASTPDHRDERAVCREPYRLRLYAHLEHGAPDGARDDDGGEQARHREPFPSGPGGDARRGKIVRFVSVGIGGLACGGTGWLVRSGDGRFRGWFWRHRRRVGFKIPQSQ